MSIEDTLRMMLYQAIATHPARLARTQPTSSETDRHHADGAYRAYLRSIAAILGAHHEPAPGTPASSTAPEAAVDRLDAVLSRAAAVDEPDLDAAQRAVHAAVPTAAAHQPAPQPMSAPMSMQDRILGTVTDIAQRAGWQVSVQPQFANTGRVYITAANTFTVQVELAYHFDTGSCGLHFHGPAIEALDLHDSPPQYRFQCVWRGRVLSYHALRYADGDRITAMLDLLTRALTPAAVAAQAAPAPDVDRAQ
jgi:hypothetical protein